MHLFFKIRAPDANDPKSWADRMSGVYGFDYSTSHFGRTTLVAWASSSDQELIENLNADDIEYKIFQVNDLDSFLGV